MRSVIFTNKIFIGLSFVLIAGYIILFSYFSITRLLSFNAHYYDLGIMDQAVYNTSRGRILELTDPNSQTNISRLAIHFDPILAFFAPFYWILPDPIILLIGQSVILGLGGIAVLLIAQHILNSRFLALISLFLYLNYYPLQLSNMFEFHAVTIATTTLLFAFYFLALFPLKKKRNNFIVGMIFVILTLLTKENTPLILIALCGYLSIKRKEKKVYLFTGLSIFVFFILVVFIMIPFFRKSQSFALSYYDYHHPLSLLRWLFSLRSIRYMISLTAPLAFLPFLAPMQFMIIIPELFINLLSSNDNMRAMYYHYTALIVPFTIIATIYGLKRLLSYVRIPLKNNAIGLLLVGVSIVVNIQSGFTDYASYQIHEESLNMVRIWRQKLKDDRIKVSTTGSIAPFFTQRKYFYNFFFDPAYQTLGMSEEEIEKNIDKHTIADYIIIYDKDIYPDDELRRKFYEELRTNEDYAFVEGKENIEVYRRVK
ncbi:MAG: DUF2079 domain-containing protein [Patescibacteria group bacterium]